MGREEGEDWRTEKKVFISIEQVLHNNSVE